MNQAVSVAETNRGEPENLLVLFRAQLYNLGYSSHTIDAYINGIQNFLQSHDKCHPLQVSEVEIQTYIENMTELKYSRSKVDQVLNAIRLFYQLLYRRPLALADVRRPIYQEPIPVLLTRDEILRIAKATGNSKHRLMVKMMYACGLKVSELVRLRVADINFNQMRVYVNTKDGSPLRILPLSHLLKRDLRNIISQKTPDAWLFPGQHINRPITGRSVEKFFKKAVEKAGLGREVTPYSLRHSFAVHLLESGIDTHCLQELLGHQYHQSTRIYKRSYLPNSQAIRSPF